MKQIFAGELSELNEDRSTALALQARINKSLLDAVSCPKCSHEFSVADAKISIEKARKNKDLVQEELVEIAKEIVSVEEDIYVADKKLSLIEKKIEEQKDYSRSLLREWDDAKDHTARTKRLLDREEESIKELETALEELKNTPISDSSEIYKEQILELKEDISQADNEVTAIEEKLSSIEESNATFVKFKTHLSNKAIGAIEVHANQYLEKTGTDISIQLNGYKMTKTKKIRENISATIFRNGEEKGSLGRFSGGEKARIEIALIMAPQNLINMNCTSGGLDLLFLDEVIESVDNSGIGGIMRSLSVTGKTILVITHGTFDQSYKYMVDVVKGADGISLIKQ